MDNSSGGTASRLAAIVESSDDAIVSKDLNGVIKSWNRAAERIFGFTAAEAIGRSILLIIPEDRRPEEETVLSRIRRGEAVEHFETIRRRKDGSLIPISLTVSPIRDEDGTVVGASKIARDITERKEADAAIRDLQNRLLTLATASASLVGTPNVAEVLSATIAVARDVVDADGYAVWRFDGVDKWRLVNAIGISPAFCAQIVSDTAGVPGKSLDFTAPRAIEDVFATPLVEARRAAYAAEGIASMLVVPLMIHAAPSGTLVFYFRSTHAFSDAEVQAAQALGNLAAGAITTAELYDRERQAQERQTFLATASATLTRSLDYEVNLKAVAALAVPQIADWCGVDIVSEQGRIEHVAMAAASPDQPPLAGGAQREPPPAEDALGSLASVIRTGQPVLMHTVTDDMLERLIDDAERREKVRALNVQSYLCVPLTARAGTIGALTLANSGSERTLTQNDLAFAQDLATRAAMAVENARAYDTARRANQLKDDFLATLSHELRTPLNAILGWAGMLGDGVFDSVDKQQHALDVIRRNAHALTEIVDDLLDVSRIVAGKLQLDLMPVDVVGLVVNAADSILPMAASKEVTLTVRPGVSHLTIAADGDRIQQVIWNLISNAVKFTGRGGRVEVLVGTGDRDVAITVRDSGIGIAPTVLPHVFEPFRQGHTGPTREYGGLGLGLAIARRIVEMHGGTIAARSEGVGHGAEFVVVLPIRQMTATIVRPDSAALA